MDYQAQRLSELTDLIRQRRRAAFDFGVMVQCMATSSRVGSGGFDLEAATMRAEKMHSPRAVAALEAIRRSNPEAYFKAAVAAGTTGDGSWAGALAPAVTLGTEFADYMRPATILGRLNTRAVPFNTKFASMTTGVAARFVGENQPAPVAALAAETIGLGVTKMSIIVPITQELAENSTPDATRTVVADCAAGIASGMDQAFLDPDRGAVIGVSPPSITNGATIIQSSGATAANILADAKSAMRALDASRFPLRECTWVMDQAVFIHLSTLVTTTGEEAFEDLADGGMWVGGLPVIVSGAAYGAQSASEGLIALMHGPSIAVADSNTALISVSLDAAIQMDTTPAAGATALTSLWQNDLVGVRVTRFVNWARRRAGCVACIRGINV